MAARYSEIEEYIMNKIHTGEWPVGYMIPKEVALCDQFGVSRSTVRTFQRDVPQRDRGRDRGAGVPLYGGDGGVGGEVR